MSKWEEALGQVDELIAAVKPADAQAILMKIIADCPDSELKRIRPRIEGAIAGFFPKRQRVVQKALSERVAMMARPVRVVQAVEDTPARPARAVVEDQPLVSKPARSLDIELRRIEHLIRTVQLNRAEGEFRKLLQSMSRDEVIAYSEVLHESILGFYPKRQRILVELLDIAMMDLAPASRGGDATEPVSEPPPIPWEAPLAAGVRHVPVSSGVSGRPIVQPERVPLSYSKVRLSQELDDLANRHIFQWSTFYRDTLSRYLDDFWEVMESGDRVVQWPKLMKASISHHATDIFQRGYRYQRERNCADPDFAVAKSLIGLQRFLDLPLELYSTRLVEAHQSDGARHLRQLCSAMVSGILTGYSTARLNHVGSRILPEFPTSWIYVLPFFTSEDLRELMHNLAPGPVVDGALESVLPLVRAVDLLLGTNPDAAPLPAFSQYSDAHHRLELSLQPPPQAVGSRQIEVHCYLDDLSVDRQLIEEAAGRAVSAVITPLSAELRMELLGAERWSDIIVPTGGEREETHMMLVALLREALDETTSISTSGNRPIDFNYAATFPLDNPFISRYSRHVYRSSVRKLMQSFEHRNGVRLWCSVRRSGKTTACTSDLGSTSGQSLVVAQTCDPTVQVAEGGFYRTVQEALDSGRRLKSDFVAKAIADCMLVEPERRIVFVLDEYETLFGDLRTSMEKDPALRYTVVQPLLNQLVLFTRDNLLIFVGQRPDAHWILTDQNQLSPAIIQNAFPLFTHRPGSGVVGEFHELVQKIMSGHVQLDPKFVDQVFLETGGHPFLTAKLLVSFGEWLIDTQRPWSCLAPLGPELFMEFSRTRLGHSSIAYDTNYELFWVYATKHLSSSGRKSDPWLHAVYSAMRNLVLSSPQTFSVPEDQFVQLASRTADLIGPEDLLSTASRANFLVHEGGSIRPRIPLLGRIAAAVRPS